MAHQAKAKLYLGNKSSKELHFPANQKPGCQLEKIKQLAYFSTREEAEAAGYDPCGHCLDGSTR